MVTVQPHFRSITSAAKAWLDNLILPSPLVYCIPFSFGLLIPDGSVLATSKAMKRNIASCQTSDIDTAVQHCDIESTSRAGNARLRTLRDQASILHAIPLHALVY